MKPTPCADSPVSSSPLVDRMPPVVRALARSLAPGTEEHDGPAVPACGPVRGGDQRCRRRRRVEPELTPVGRQAEVHPLRPPAPELVLVLRYREPARGEQAGQILVGIGLLDVVALAVRAVEVRPMFGQR